MFGKRNSIKLIALIVTISLLFVQFSIISKNGMNVVKATHETIVAFDETHNPMTVVNANNPNAEGSGRYDSFVKQLEINSYTVETIDYGEILNPITLENYDILVILCSQTSYTTEEITEIDTWVKNGGNLLLVTDWTIYGNGMRSLFRNFGYDYPDEDGLKDIDDTVNFPLQFYIDQDNIVEHNITSGVNRIEIYAGTGFNETAIGAINLIDTDDNDTTTWDSGGFANNITILSALTGGSAGDGKLVVITDFNLWDNTDADHDGHIDFFDSDNARLAITIMSWLAGLSPPSIPSPIISPINYFSVIILIALTSIVFIKRKRK